MRDCVTIRVFVGDFWIRWSRDIGGKFEFEVFLPVLYKVLKLVAAGTTGLADTLDTGKDLEGVQKTGEAASADGVVDVPGSRRAAVQPLEQDGSREALRIAVMGKAIAYIGQNLQALFEFEV